MARNQVTLWSWLTKSETKEEFRCPPGLQVTNEELTNELSRQVRANNLPAQVELCEVNWDDTNTRQTRAMVRYTGPDAKTDVVRMLVGVDQMGNFAYVERKTYLKPPTLPAAPRGRKDEIGTWVGGGSAAFLIGVAVMLFIFAAIFGLISGDVSVALFCAVPGGVLLLIGLAIQSKTNKTEQEISGWNKQAKAENVAWDQAWSSWRKEVVQAAYLARTDDVFGRFTSAISATVDDVIQTLFVDRNAELRRKTEHEQTQEAIEKELERRRAEAFK